VHELSIATAIVERAGELARVNGTDTVSAVTVRVGELAGVVPDALDFAFEVAREGTPLARAGLVVEPVPARAWCEPCSEEFAVGVPPFFWCPACDRPSTELRSGRELEITHIRLAGPPDRSGCTTAVRACSPQGGRRGPDRAMSSPVPGGDGQPIRAQWWNPPEG
jgi:hydrogenase nickel incorporation protein HypA/HybF